MEKTSFIESVQDRLTRFVALSQTIGARSDYVQGGGGNTSVKLDETRMCIKASGYCLSDVQANDGFAVLDYAALRSFYGAHTPADFADVEAAGSACAKSAVLAMEGIKPLRPSVEAGFHSILDTFVAHSHSVYANLAACSVEMERILNDAFQDAPYAVGFVPYTDPGARLTFAIQAELSRVQQRTGKRPAVLFMQNHGVIVHHDDDKTCLSIHADANERIARAFGVTGESFPKPRVKAGENGGFVSDTPYLKDALRSGSFSDETLLLSPLYPDQLVFFTGTLGETAQIDYQTGDVVYDLPQKTALVVEETLTAVAFLTAHIKQNGYTLSTMGEAAKRFIANWESEKYRKSLANSGK